MIELEDGLYRLKISNNIDKRMKVESGAIMLHKIIKYWDFIIEIKEDVEFMVELLCVHCEYDAIRTNDVAQVIESIGFHINRYWVEI